MTQRRPHLALLGQGSWTLVANLGTKVQAASLVAAAGIASGTLGVAQVSMSAGLAVVVAAGVDFGFSTDWSRRLAASKGSGSAAIAMPGVLVRMSIASVVGGLLSLTLARATAIPLPSVASVWVGVWTGATLLASSATLMRQGMGRFRETSLVSGGLRLLGAVFLMAVAMSHSAVAVIAVASLGEVVIATVLMRCLLSNVPERLTTRKARVSGDPDPAYAWLGVGSLVNTLINKSDTLIVSAVAGVVGTAMYSVASQVQNAVTTIALAPSAATLAYVARSRGQELGKTAVVIRSAARTVSALAAGISVTCLTTSLLLIHSGWQFPLRDELERSLLPVAICLIAAPISVHAATHLSACVGFAGHRDVAIVWLATAVVALPGFLVLAVHWAALGAALGALCRDVVLLILSKRLWREMLERQAISHALGPGSARHTDRETGKVTDPLIPSEEAAR